MLKRHTWIFAALVVAGCGGGGPESEQAAGTAPAGAEQAAAQGSQAAAEQTPGAAAPQSSQAAAAAQQSSAVAALSTSTDSPTSTRFQLGTHYTRLSPTQPTSSSPDQVEVTEVFWYGCPHCFTFDPHLASWQGRKADYVNFVRVPAVWNELVKLHARAFYTAEALGKGAEMHEALFREIHVNQNPLDTQAKLQDFFGKFNVSAADFKSAFDSFAVHTKLQRADELSRRYRIASVPTVVINGKYVTDASMAGGYDEVLELANELAASERNGR
jgi:protein dithiol oxidoreductase (disulfide-forming)